MSPSRPGRRRLGLRPPLCAAVLVGLAGLSCLNPRPDDQPLLSGESDSNGSGIAPPAVNVDDGRGPGDGTSGDGSLLVPDSEDVPTGSNPADTEADAGSPAPDAGHGDEPDAGATGD